VSKSDHATSLLPWNNVKQLTKPKFSVASHIFKGSEVEALTDVSPKTNDG
jgi:hypothetical protein